MASSAVTSTSSQKKSIAIYYKIEDLKQTSKKFIFKDTNVWQKHYELLEVYKKLILVDLDYALEKKAEVDLWNVGFKEIVTQIQSEANSRSILDKSKKSEAQSNLTWFLDFASGFYVLLLQELMTLYDLDLPFMRSASYYGVSDSVGENSEAATNSTSGSTGSNEVMVKCSNVSNINYICAHMQVHLGDLARYRGQNKRAENFYRHSLKVAPASGHAYNQLALLEVNKGCSLTAIFYYIRALALKCPFPAGNNMKLLFAFIFTIYSSFQTSFILHYISLFHSLFQPFPNVCQGHVFRGHRLC